MFFYWNSSVPSSSKIVYNNHYVLFLGCLLFLFSGCRKDTTDTSFKTDLDTALEARLELLGGSDGKSFFMFPESDDYDAIPQDPKNPLTPQKVELGQLLYHETGLALAPMQDISTGTYSCATCHFAEAGFQAGRVQGIGDGGTGIGLKGEGRGVITDYEENELDVQPIRTPTSMNTAFQELMLWNGQFGAVGANIGTEEKWVEDTPIATNKLGYHGLETQAIAGLDVHRLVIDSSLIFNTIYKTMFDEVFSDFPQEERYTGITAGLAIAAYERTLFASQAPFQKWLKQEYEAMTVLEKQGALLFFDEAECVNCHTGPALSEMEFHALGMNHLYTCPEPVFNTPENSNTHQGRGGFTGKAADMHKFKTPQLYNLKDNPFLGHGSSFHSIEKVITYKNEAIPQVNIPSSQLAEGFHPLNLTTSEIEALTAFLSEALYDDNLIRYVPNSLPSGNCFPNNDLVSKSELGCE